MKGSYVMYKINNCGRHYLRLIYNTVNQELCIFDKSIDKSIGYFSLNTEEFEELVAILDSENFFEKTGKACDELSRSELVVDNINIK